MAPARALSGSLLLFGLVQAGVATACSPRSGYRVPTTLDLAVQADTIVLVQVTGGRGFDAAAAGGAGAVETRPILLLKGARLPGRIDLPDAALTSDPRQVTSSDPRELREANPDAFTGGCSRYLFRRNMTLVLFLARRDGRLAPIRRPFARDVEDVASSEALWVKAVREYVIVSMVPTARRRQVPVDRIAALTRRTGDRDAAAIAADMRREPTMADRPPLAR